jgi:Mn2+/Fe2+ NRAMP family transporter
MPTLPRRDLHGVLLYGYFAVGVFSAVLMVYEVHFYSSGAIEEDWKAKDLTENFFVAGLGATLGAVLTAALLVLGAMVFQPHGIFPEILSSSLIAEAFPFAQRGLVIALLGSLACISGAALETALSGAYNVCQFFNLQWGKDMPAKSAPAYTLAWTAMLVLGMAISLTGIRPLTLINISVIFGMVVMPFTYYPILRVAEDKNIMGVHVNSKTDTAVGWVFLVLITLAAAAALPLMALTHSGQP